MLTILEPSTLTGCVGGNVKTMLVVGVLRLSNFPLLMCQYQWFLWFHIVAVRTRKALVCVWPPVVVGYLPSAFTTYQLISQQQSETV